ncbi:hypothetical protein ACWDTP_08760 [Mycobacterium sp. NPDC003449]
MKQRTFSVIDGCRRRRELIDERIDEGIEIGGFHNWLPTAFATSARTQGMRDGAANKTAPTWSWRPRNIEPAMNMARAKLSVSPSRGENFYSNMCATLRFMVTPRKG